MSKLVRPGPTRGGLWLSRRQVLTGIGAGLGGLILSGCDKLRPDSGPVRASERFNKVVQHALFRAGAELHPGADALTPEGMFPSGHYMITVDAHGNKATPVIPADWRLKIGGNVQRPLSLSVEDLMKLPRTDSRIEHHCVEGWSAVADWHGVRLSDLAQAAGAGDGDYVEFKSFDRGPSQMTDNIVNYWSSWDRDSAMHAQTLIAYGMNNKPLELAHGAPARLYGAVKLGYKQVKWLTEINFVDTETGGYWEEAGYEWYAGT